MHMFRPFHQASVSLSAENVSMLCRSQRLSIVLMSVTEGED